MIRDVIYKYCSVLDHTAEIKRDCPVSDSEGGRMVALEQHAGGPNVPGDIMVRLSCGRSTSTKTFYDMNVINSHNNAAIGKSLGTAGLGTRIDSVLSEAYDRKSRKHAAAVARGGRFLTLLVTTSGVWNGDFLASSVLYPTTSLLAQANTALITGVPLSQSLAVLSRVETCVIVAAQRTLSQSGNGGDGARARGGAMDKRMLRFLIIL